MDKQDIYTCTFSRLGSTALLQPAFIKAKLTMGKFTFLAIIYTKENKNIKMFKMHESCMKKAKVYFCSFNMPTQTGYQPQKRVIVHFAAPTAMLKCSMFREHSSVVDPGFNPLAGQGESVCA